MAFFNSAVTTLQTIVVASAVPCVFGAASTFWKVTGRITRPAMLMYGKEASNRNKR